MRKRGKEGERDGESKRREGEREGEREKYEMRDKKRRGGITAT